MKSKNKIIKKIIKFNLLIYLKKNIDKNVINSKIIYNMIVYSNLINKIFVFMA